MLSNKYFLIRVIILSCTVVLYLMFTIACNSYNKDINSTNSTNYSTIDSLIASISKDTVALEKYLDLAITTGDV